MINWTFAREVGLPKWAARTVRRQIDKRVWRRDSRMVLPTGQAIILSRGSPSAGEVFVTDADIDWGAERLFARFADRTRDFFDVGAHIGYYSLYLSPLVRRAWAFEPDGRNHAALRANLALAGNVEHVDKAVSTTSGTVFFATESNSAVGHVAPTGVAVDAVSLDDFARATGARPCLVKVDVEGHDLAVLEGARGVLADHQPLVLTEWTQGSGDNDTERLFGLITDAGYAAFAIVWQPGTGSWRRAPQRRLAMADTALLAGTPVKMIFLAPPRLHAEFERIVRTGEPL